MSALTMSFCEFVDVPELIAMVRTVAGMLHRGGGPSRERRSSGRSGPLIMPHKANAGRRHHIPRPKRRVINWAAYDVALRRRGSLTGLCGRPEHGNGFRRGSMRQSA